MHLRAQGNMNPPIRSLICLLLLAYSTSGVLAETKYPRTLPCDVTKNNPSVIFDCSSRRLKYVPAGTYSDVTEIKLSGNFIKKISKESFQGLNNLMKINLNKNHYSKAMEKAVDPCEKGMVIEDGAFANMTKLIELLADETHLCKIPAGMPLSLTSLSLRFNGLFSLSQQNFSELMQLKELYLDRNCFTGYSCERPFLAEPTAFSGLSALTVLSLSLNNLSQVPSQLPSSLKELYLSSNKIKMVNHYDFQNLSNIEVLDLSGNCPRCFNAPFPCDPCPGDSSIQIHPLAFQYLANLRNLSLSCTSLTHIPSSWFYNTSQLKVLNLGFNYLLKEIALGEFLVQLPHLEVLDLSFNYARQAYPKYINISDNFANLVRLQQLHIRGYVFQDLTHEHLQPLIKLTNLHTLNFGVNFIKQIDLRVFQLFVNLTLISLSDNRISPLSEGSNNSDIHGTSLGNHVIRHRSTDTYLDPSANNMLESGGTSSSYKSAPIFPLIKPQCSMYGKALDLSLNSVFFIAQQQFKGFHDVACLNLSSNGIGQALNGTEFIFLPNLKYLDLSFNKLDLAYSYAFHELQNLEVLDLSYNKHYFIVSGITHRLVFLQNLMHLKVLNLSYNEISTLTEPKLISSSLEELVFKGNRLDILWKNGDNRYRCFFKELSKLTHLDISHNRLKSIPNKAFYCLPQSLIELRINNNELQHFKWKALKQFQNLKLLDVSRNLLSFITDSLASCTSSLQTLLLQYNKIAQLPDGFLFKASSLLHLDVGYNRLHSINQSTFLSNDLNYLVLLNLKGNPFECTCAIVGFINWIHLNINVSIPRLATDVICATPGDQTGNSIISLDQHTCTLDIAALICFSLSFIIIFTVMVMAITKHLFYWDAWYTYYYCAARLKGYRSIITEKALYDAYIAYDTKDVAVTDWVINELRIHLEESKDKQVLLCLEERDWEPGKAVIDNLAQSIQCSRKTIFVLTERYVKNGNFRTAFYIALQRLMDENLDVIVFILLEPVLQHSQYLRLRRRICRSSILEWPKNPQAQCLFWQSLKNVLLTENYNRYNRLYTDSIK
ncbi:toll-like receptor 8 isoform X2 [Alligator sinensis]|uniref:Toll-like receptor 8 isoform X2 n=1 Tax=Alligator sinensis TaxID=38654 RepID=A0A3Q0GFR0_ALLSI|nr:toll-like receptor 8 isoform X2 [Alligator sinensis]